MKHCCVVLYLTIIENTKRVLIRLLRNMFDFVNLGKPIYPSLDNTVIVSPQRMRHHYIFFGMMDIVDFDAYYNFADLSNFTS